MPEKRTLARARRARRAGKSPSTQAGEFVREEIEHVREGKHGVRSAKQAIAIGLSKARRAGVKLKRPGKGTTSETKRRARAMSPRAPPLGALAAPVASDPPRAQAGTTEDRVPRGAGQAGARQRAPKKHAVERQAPCRLTLPSSIHNPSHGRRAMKPEYPRSHDAESNSTRTDRNDHGGGLRHA